MAEPFLGEIRMMSFDYPPKGWALCNGGTLPINQNQALFALYGTTFGGDGRVNFGLPNMQGKVPIHRDGSSYRNGTTGGEQAHTLSISEMPTHPHFMVGYKPGTGTATASPNGNLLGAGNNFYRAATAPLTTLSPQSIQNAGGSQQHNNMQPYQAISFCVALQGIFPSPN